jgi:very-short-patch-repair endonuclease
MTDSEKTLWQRIRRKQLMGIQFYRQKPIGNFIVDFFAPKLKLIIEVDGSQHFQAAHLLKDSKRDEYLTGLGLKVLRFNNREVLKETEAVLQKIYRTMEALME